MFKLHAHAKVNLHLEVGPRLKSGYHPIRSLCVKVDLYDTLWVKITQSGYTISGLIKNIPLEQDILYRSFQFYQKISKENFGLDIRIKKRIPMCSGLGGASSNAAVLLNFLNHYYNEKVPEEILIEKSTCIGADIPLFINKSQCLWIEGIGEKISNFPARPIDILLLFPNIGTSTSEAYHHLDHYITNFGKITKYEALSTWLKNYKDWNYFNSFSKHLSSEYPIVKQIIDHLRNRYQNEIYCNLSGSGSTIFVIGAIDLLLKIKNSDFSPDIIQYTHVKTLI